MNLTLEDIKNFRNKYFTNKQINLLDAIDEASKEVSSCVDENTVLYGDVVLDITRQIGNKHVIEECKNIGKEIEVVYTVDDMREFENSMMLYLACLIDKVNSGIVYSVSLKFEKEKDRGFFSDYVNAIYLMVSKQNPLVDIRY